MGKDSRLNVQANMEKIFQELQVLATDGVLFSEANETYLGQWEAFEALSEGEKERTADDYHESSFGFGLLPIWRPRPLRSGMAAPATIFVCTAILGKMSGICLILWSLSLSAQISRLLAAFCYRARHACQDAVRNQHAGGSRERSGVDVGGHAPNHCDGSRGASAEGTDFGVKRHECAFVCGL